MLKILSAHVGERYVLNEWEGDGGTRKKKCVGDHFDVMADPI
jgi:hypothetical protein